MVKARDFFFGNSTNLTPGEILGRDFLLGFVVSIVIGVIMVICGVR